MDNPKAIEKAKEFPLLPNWMTRYSGDNQYDHPVRSHHTDHGSYQISPLFDKSSTLSGYSLKFCHTGKGKQTALWHDLGVFSHPGKAHAAARKHARGMKTESVLHKVARIVHKIRSAS